MPTGTTLRFTTFALLAAATTLYVFGIYASVWPTTAGQEGLRCQVRSGLYLTASSSVDPDEGKWSRYRECMSAMLGARAAWLLGGLLLLFVVALVIYLVRPAWRIRRSRLVPLEGALADELRDTLAALVAEAGLRTAPEFVLDPARFRAGGVAFGNHRRKVVCLDAGLVALHRRDPESFRALVLHELAHVRSDVTTTYATLAVWRSFLAVTLVPFVLISLDPMLLSRTPWRLALDFSLPSGAVGARLAALVLLVFLSRIAVLRSREKYADAMVARWTGTDDPYRNLRPTRSIRRWLAVHPTRAGRLAAMRDPDSLSRPGFLETFTSALAVQIAWWHTVSGLQDLTWYHADNASMPVMRIVWAIGAAVLVGTVAWRGAAYLRTAGQSRRGVFALPGLALGLGFACGRFASAWGVGPVKPAGVVASIPLVCVALLVCCWVGHCATLARTRVHGVLIGIAAVVVCFVTLGWFSELQAADKFWRGYMVPYLDLLHGYATSDVETVVLDVVVVPFLLNHNRVPTVAALVLVWLVPLALRRELPRPAVGLGLVGAVVASTAILLLGSSDDPPQALVLTAWGVLLVVGVQLAVAIVVARRSGRVAALLATWLIGLVATVALWFAHLDGTVVDSVVAARPHQVLPVLGTIAGLVGGLAAGGGGRRTGQARPVRVALIAVVSVGLASWWPHSDGKAPLEASPAVWEIDYDFAVAVWAQGGGWDQFTSVVQGNSRFATALDSGNDTAVADTCEAQSAVLRDAREFPPPPEDHVRDEWIDALDTLANATQACLRVLREGDTDVDGMLAQFLRGLDRLKAAQELILAARERALANPPDIG
ncbi:hypothetical protein GCM10022243_26950 [Saccharothrix violaceirubra]|uniref:Peptidase M48 domain-containing protein n=1 Tax=Saccharothrix violaceirubra TaxID=413306 RepID=A0A7W7TA61_9PSEU|nr:M48 family metalloprotease [Saccharothrix violaceirubra]MBB4969382.1 hypothetical protein [Saccharothrix violaceirubra]